jgi:hypothetical protein
MSTAPPADPPAARDRNFLTRSRCRVKRHEPTNIHSSDTFLARAVDTTAPTRQCDNEGVRNLTEGRLDKRPAFIETMGACQPGPLVARFRFAIGVRQSPTEGCFAQRRVTVAGAPSDAGRPHRLFTGWTSKHDRSKRKRRPACSALT